MFEERCITAEFRNEMLQMLEQMPTSSTPDNRPRPTVKRTLTTQSRM
jgi:hypothetical protein